MGFQYKRRIPGVATICCVVMAAPYMLYHSLFTNDTFWHIKYGELILSTGSIPSVDIFSFTAPGVRLVDHSWLTDVIFSFCEKRGGLVLLETLGIVLVALISRLVYSTARSLGATPLAGCAAIFFFVISSNRLLLLRPQLFSFLLLAWLFRSYITFRERNCRQIWFSPAVMILWSNLHGGFLVGVLLLFALSVLEYAEKRFCESGSRCSRRAKDLLVLGVCSLILACLNPRGIWIYQNALANTPLLDQVHLSINEWRQPVFENIPFFEPILIFSIVILIFLKKKPPLFESAAFIVSTHLALTVWRHIPLFGITGLPVLAAWTTRIFDQYGFFTGMLGEKCAALNKLIGLEDRIVKSFILIIVIVVCLGSVSSFLTVDILNSPAIRARYPVLAADWINSNKITGRMFNPYKWGGFLIYTLYPTHKVYIDSRIVPYKKRVIKDYFTIYSAGDGWQKLLAAQGIKWLLLDREAPLLKVATASPDWKMVYSDKSSFLFSVK